MRRLLTTAMLLGVVLAATSCHLQIGCTTYRLFEPTPTSGFTVDRSACTTGTTTPPPVLPEAPIAILIPVVGLASAGAVVVRRRRRRDS